MPDEVRVGVIGTSGWTEFMYLGALKDYPRTRLAAICGRNRTRAEEVAAKFGIPTVFTDYGEMIDRGGLDAVIVSTPDDTHAEMTLRAVAAGLHVLCEKPLATDAGAAREMLRQAEAARVKHMTYFTYRWQPAICYLRALLDDGAVGRIYQCEVNYRMGYARGPEYAWRYDRRRANGILGDLGSHAIDLARFLVGEIALVNGSLGYFVERPGPDGQPMESANDSALLQVRFANGAHGAIVASSVSHRADQWMQQQINLYGEAGTLELTLEYFGPNMGVVLRAARSSDEQLQTLPVPDAYWGDMDRADFFSLYSRQPVGVRQFVDAIADDQPVKPTFYDGYRVQQVIDAALESDATGRAVPIDLTI